MNIAAIVGTLFVAGLLTVAGVVFRENLKGRTNQWGWNNFLVLWWENWRHKVCWQHLRLLWWLWLIFGGDGGVALALCLILLIGPPTSPTQAKSVFLALDDGQKWRFSELLRNAAVAQNGERISCEFALGLSSNNQFVWGVWSELQPMLDLAWWRHAASGDLGLGQRQFPAGFTILAGTDKEQAFICAAALGRTLQDTFAPSMPVTVRTNQVTEALNGCNNNCVELDIGGFRTR
jgi:hypothetical protein